MRIGGKVKVLSVVGLTRNFASLLMFVCCDIEVNYSIFCVEL